MQLKKHKITSIDDVFFAQMWEIYTQSFPLVEQREYSDYVNALEDFACNLYVYYDDKNKVQALLQAWDFPTSSFIEFYAIANEARGQGLGTQILEEYKTTTKKNIILEIEDICDEATKRRWQFYKRLNFQKYNAVYVHPPYQKDFATFNLNVLSYPSILTEQEYNTFVYEEKKISLKYTYYKGEVL